METLSDILAQTSDPAPAPETQPTSVPESAAPTTQVEDYPENVKAYLEKNPDHKPYVELVNKEFQSAFTPKLQRYAELQKMVDGVDPQAIQTLRQLQQLAETNPEQVAQWYRSQADLLHQQPSYTQPEQPANPWDAIEPVTDAEALLLQKVKEMDSWRTNFQQQQENERLVAKGTQVKAERNALQQEFGVQIPDHELVHVWDTAERGNLTIRQAYLALNSERLLPTLLQRARDEASGVVQTKVNLNAGNPGATAPRQSGNNTSKGTLQDYFAEIRNA